MNGLETCIHKQTHVLNQPPNLWLWLKRPPFCGQNVRGRNVVAKTSLAKKPLAEISYVRLNSAFVQLESELNDLVFQTGTRNCSDALVARYESTIYSR